MRLMPNRKRKWIVGSTWGRNFGRFNKSATPRCERDVVHRMNEGYEAWGTLKIVLRNINLA